MNKENENVEKFHTYFGVTTYTLYCEDALIVFEKDRKIYQICAGHFEFYLSMVKEELTRKSFKDISLYLALPKGFLDPTFPIDSWWVKMHQERKLCNGQCDLSARTREYKYTVGEKITDPTEEAYAVSDIINAPSLKEWADWYFKRTRT